MTATRMVQLWRAETRKLLSRSLARVGLLLAVVLGLVGPLWLQVIANSAAEVNNAPIVYDTSGPDALLWALFFRNALVMRLLLIALVALGFAGEYHARTLRDDLVQPVPRWSVLLAKWLAQGVWLSIGAALTWLVAMVLGTILFGADGPWRDAATAYGLTIVCDLGFTAIVLAFVTMIRSVAGTIVAMVLFMGGDALLSVVLKGVEWLGQQAELPAAAELAVQARPWLPSHALGLWGAFGGESPFLLTAVLWQNIAGLGLYTVVGLALAMVWFRRMDVP